MSLSNARCARASAASTAASAPPTPIVAPQRRQPGGASGSARRATGAASDRRTASAGSAQPARMASTRAARRAASRSKAAASAPASPPESLERLARAAPLAAALGAFALAAPATARDVVAFDLDPPSLMVEGTMHRGSGSAVVPERETGYPAGIAVLTPAGTFHWMAARDGDVRILEIGSGPSGRVAPE